MKPEDHAPDRHQPSDDGVEDDEAYEPGDTLNRGMSLACGLVLIFFALLSCGFIASVLSQHR